MSWLTGSVGKVALAGEDRWIIKHVVGQEDGMGVECLSGSGAIAAAYARAFREGLTITYVSSRTVGIGAYLARLGRCAQLQQHALAFAGSRIRDDPVDCTQAMH